MLLTLDKPAGLPVMRPHDDPEGDCLLARLLRDRPERQQLPWPTGFEGGIAHRLDTGTSGAVAVAENPDELEALRAAFSSHVLVKTYRFLTDAAVPWTTNRCTHPIGHARRHKNRMIVQRGRNTPHRGQWLQATTQFRQIDGPLWEATMSSGVMHQIRVHAAFVGLPLAGDPLYGGGVAPPHGHPFCLHHTGFIGGPWATSPVSTPPWASGS